MRETNTRKLVSLCSQALGIKTLPKGPMLLGYCETPRPGEEPWFDLSPVRPLDPAISVDHFVALYVADTSEKEEKAGFPRAKRAEGPILHKLVKGILVISFPEREGTMSFLASHMGVARVVATFLTHPKIKGVSILWDGGRPICLNAQTCLGPE